MQPESTVYLVDSSIYVYRAWHLTPKSICDASGTTVNAVHGFAEFLCQLLQQSKAQYIACAFDHPARPSVRQQIYPAYKSGRSATPALLRPQFALCQQLTNLMGIPQFSVARFEADDIIDTLAHAMRADNKNVCVISGDKDLTQCIKRGDLYWNFGQKLTLDHRIIEKRFGVKPSQFPDMLALSGDKTDNIPGVPGIGYSTAARLLKKWGNLDVLFDHLDEAATMKFRGAAIAVEQLREHEDQVRLSRRLSGLLHVSNLCQHTAELALRPIETATLVDFLQDKQFSEAQQANVLRSLADLPRSHACPTGMTDYH